MFKPRTGTSPDLVSVAYFDMLYLLVSSLIFLSLLNVCPGGQPTPALYPSISTLTFSQHRFIRPPGSPLSPSHNTDTLRSLNQLPPTLPLPLYACHIHVASPLPPPKSLLTYPSAVSEPHFSDTMAHVVSPLPRRLSPYCKPHK